jgi:hypothetical protein
LNGDGSGDPEEIQFRPLRKLTRLFDERSIHGSFDTEVMQQIAFRRFEGEYPHLKPIADAWEKVVTDAFRRGHDFQLHLHSQWKEAAYDGKKWNLTAPWSIIQHSREDADRMIREGIQLLENLLRPIDPAYRCVSYRSGSWCIAPSEFMLELLAQHNIDFDISIVNGIYFNNKRLQLDYRYIEEGFFPFYPDMKDARKVAPVKQDFVCVPANSFWGPRTFQLRRDCRKVAGKLFGARGTNKSYGTSEVAYGSSNQDTYTQSACQSSLPTRLLRRLQSYIQGSWITSDLAFLNYQELSDMLRYIRLMAKRSGLDAVPVILQNHTKAIKDFSHIARFLDDVAVASDLTCITLTELAAMLRSGKFQIRSQR